MSYLPVNFYTGTYEKYKQLLANDNIADNCLYFCEDTRTIFRGGEVIPVPYVVLQNGELPSTQDAIKDLLYIDNENNKIFVYDGLPNFVSIFGDNIVHIDAIKSINWKEDSRTLTLPTIDNNGELATLNIQLGRDLILDTAKYDAVNRKIVLVFVTSDETDDVTKTVEIPVDDLVDLYRGKNTSSIKMTINEETNTGSVDEREVQAELIVYNADLTNEKQNAIIVKDTGVYVPDLSNDIAEVRQLATEGINLGQQAQATADQGVSDAAAAQSSVDNLSEEVHGEGLVLNSPVLTNALVTFTVDQNIDWTEGNNGELVASIAYVQNAIQYANTWRALRRNTTWAQLRGE